MKTRIAILVTMIAACLSAYDSAKSTGQPPSIEALDWSHNGKYLAAGSSIGEINIYDLGVGSQAKLPNQDNAAILSLAWSPHSDKLLSVNYSYAVKIWSAFHNDSQPIALQEYDLLLAATWSNDGNRIATMLQEGTDTLKVWDSASGELLITETHGTSLSMAWSPEGNHLALGRLRGDVLIIDTQTFKRKFILEDVLLRRPETRILQWSISGEYLLSGDGWGQIFLWDVINRKLIRVFQGTDAYAVNPWEHKAVEVQFSADEQYVTSANADGTLRMWKVSTGKLIYSAKVPKPITSAAWSPYGAQLAVGSMIPAQATARGRKLMPGVQIVVPFASLEQFNAIANVCITDSTAKASLQDSATLDKVDQLAASVRALPTDAIPPACAADLLAIAEALQAQ